MPALLTRVPAQAVGDGVERDDLVGLVAVDGYRAGERLIAVLPGGRAVAGVMLRLGRAWWLIVEAEELIALGPTTELFRALLFRPI